MTSDAINTLQTILLDNIRMVLMQRAKEYSMVALFFTFLITTVFAWGQNLFIDQEYPISEIVAQFRGLYSKRCSLTLEGKHMINPSAYAHTAMASATVFSTNFRAVLNHIITNKLAIDRMRNIKEFSIHDKKANWDKVHNGTDDMFFSNDKRPFLLDDQLQIYCIMSASREVSQSKGTSKTVVFSIQLYSHITDLHGLTAFVDTLRAKYLEEIETKRSGKLFVYTLIGAESQNDDDNCDCWQETQLSTTKSFSNIFFEGKAEILKKIEFYVNNRQWYETHGIPYTLGFGLHGPPGTGKTSFIKALAKHLNRHIVSISLKMIKTKQQLEEVYYESVYSENNKASPIQFKDKIIVFEDIDCVGDIVLQRKGYSSKYAPHGKRNMLNNRSAPGNNKDSDNEDNAESDQDDEKDKDDIEDETCEMIDKRDLLAEIDSSIKKTAADLINTANMVPTTKGDSITLDDILNMWDGIRENSGRIIVITSNYYNKLDGALIRPGRIDVSLKLENTTRGCIREMYELYYGVKMTDEQYEKLPDKKHSPAKLINFYVSNPTDPEEFLRCCL